ncbi:MAG: hypothetical protein AAF569_07675 [Pseudomonadota bacterium]
MSEDNGKVVSLGHGDPESRKEAKKQFISKVFSMLAAPKTGDAETDAVLGPETYLNWVTENRTGEPLLSETQWEAIEAWGFTDGNRNINQPYIDFIDQATPQGEEVVGDFFESDDIRISFSLNAMGITVDQIVNYVDMDQLKSMDIDRLEKETTMCDWEIGELRRLQQIAMTPK